MSSDAPRAPTRSQQESSPQPLSHWLQLMLAEIHAKREAQEHARAEDERRRAEAGGTAPS